MNRAYQVLLALTATITFFLALETITPIIFTNGDASVALIIVSTELKNISQTDINYVKKEARKTLKYIPPILGIEYNDIIVIKIVDRGMVCNATGGIVSLLISHIRDKCAPIIHEVTHVITSDENNSFLTEGLAVYFQERFGDNQAFPNFSVPFNVLMRRNKDQFIPITRLINDNEIFSQVDTEQRKMAYLTAGSFINFLVEQYGEKKLAELNNSKTLSYMKVYGKDINQLETEWKNHVFKENTQDESHIYKTNQSS